MIGKLVYKIKLKLMNKNKNYLNNLKNQKNPKYQKLKMKNYLKILKSQKNY